MSTIETPSADPSRAAAQTRPKSILVVDDDPGVLKVVRRALEGRYEVRTAEDGSTAVRLFCARRPDLVLLDVRFPDGDGLRILRELKTLDPNLSVVMLTGDSHLETVAHAFDDGATAYLTKPFALEDVENLVDYALTARENAERTRESRRAS